MVSTELLMARIRAKHFPRGWSFVQGARCLPILVGVPVTGYLNLHSGNKAGYYVSFVFVILGAVTLFFMDFWKSRHHHRHDKSCEGHVHNNDNIIIEQENLSQKLSDVHNSVGGAGHSLVLSEHDSVKEAESLNNNKVTFTMVVPIDEDDQGEDER